MPSALISVFFGLFRWEFSDAGAGSLAHNWVVFQRANYLCATVFRNSAYRRFIPSDIRFRAAALIRRLFGAAF